MLLELLNSILVICLDNVYKQIQFKLLSGGPPYMKVIVQRKNIALHKRYLINKKTFQSNGYIVNKCEQVRGRTMPMLGLYNPLR